jgi:hypothetical protein
VIAKAADAATAQFVAALNNQTIEEFGHAGTQRRERHRKGLESVAFLHS